MAEQRINLAIVIRKDGTVPFDEGHPHKERILGHLVTLGNVVEKQPDGTHKIISGPHKP